MYQYLLAYQSVAAGESHTATVYDSSGVALVSQPAYTIRDLGAGGYLYVAATMPSGQVGAVEILNGATLIGVGVVNPLETEWPSGLPLPPSPPNICILYDYEQSEHGLVEGVPIAVSLASPPQTTGTGILEASVQNTESRWDGYWEVPLVQGKQYLVSIPTAGVRNTITAPSTARAQLRTLLP